MNKNRSLVLVVMALGILALVAGFFAHLALTDIYHGESDTSVEWKVVQVTALIIFVFIVSSLFTFGRTLKQLKN